MSRPFWCPSTITVRPREIGQTADQRVIVAKRAVAVQFDEIGRQLCDVIEGVRPIGMAGELDPVPCGQSAGSPGSVISGSRRSSQGGGRD